MDPCTCQQLHLPDPPQTALTAHKSLLGQTAQEASYRYRLSHRALDEALLPGMIGSWNRGLASLSLSPWEVLPPLKLRPPG